MDAENLAKNECFGGVRKPRTFDAIRHATCPLYFPGWKMVTPAFAAAAKQLLAEVDDATSPQAVAAKVVQACEQLSQHLARIVGEIGIRTLFVRSVIVTSARFPWLANTPAGTTPTDSPWVSLRTAMEQQDPHTTSEAFVVLLSTFAELLGRLIGERLVARLLYEVWPGVFSHAA